MDQSFRLDGWIKLEVVISKLQCLKQVVGNR